MILWCPSVDMDASIRHNNSLNCMTLLWAWMWPHNLENLTGSSNLGIEYMYVILSKSVDLFWSYHGNEFSRDLGLTFGAYKRIVSSKQHTLLHIKIWLRYFKPFRRYGAPNFCTSNLVATLTLKHWSSKPNQLMFVLNYTNNQSLVKFRPLACKISR